MAVLVFRRLTLRAGNSVQCVSDAGKKVVAGKNKQNRSSPRSARRRNRGSERRAPGARFFRCASEQPALDPARFLLWEKSLVGFKKKKKQKNWVISIIAEVPSGLQIRRYP
jgi:hypothetical protein